MKKENIIELKEQGYTIIRNLVNENWLDLLRDALDKAFIEHRKTQLNNNNDIQTNGVALHVLLSNPIFINFLEELQSKNFLNSFRNLFLIVNV
jgi:hypothetical protein